MTPFAPNKTHQPLTVRLVWCLCLGAKIGFASVHAAAFIWTGSGAIANWSSATNWSGGIPPVGGADLVFPFGVPTASLTNNNDFPAGTEFNSITISGSSYSLSGNAIALGSAATPGSGSLIINSGLAGNISLGIQLGGPGSGQQYFTVNSGANLALNGQLSGTTGARLTKQGPGMLVLRGNNGPFTGPILISAGILRIANANALGDLSAGTTVGVNSQLQIADVSGAIQESLALNGGGAANDGALLNISGSNVWSGGIVLLSDSSIGASAGALNVTGQISDSGAGHDLTKQGSGVVFLSNPNGNTYRGVTVINNGALLVNNASGSATGTGPVIVSNSITAHGVLGGAGIISGQVTVQGGATIAPPGNSGTLCFTGTVTNNGAIVASNGCVIAFFGLVANNGVITSSGGTIRFYGTLINNGTIPPDSFPQVRLSWPMREGSDALVAWTGLAGSNYVLQVATNLSNAAGAFHDVSPVITVQGKGEGVTNYLDAGAFTNSTVRFYRVRSSP